MSRILVTGAAGFIGGHIVEQLLKHHHRVLVVDNFSTGKLDNLPEQGKNLVIEECDIVNLTHLLGLVLDFKPDHVIHLAAQSAITTAENNPVRDLTVNATGTLNVILAAKQCCDARIVFASTSAVYRKSHGVLTEEAQVEPDTNYGISKMAAESYLRLYENAVCLRFGNVYGPRQVPIGENQVIARMCRHFTDGEEFYIFGDGKQKRDFVYVTDVAEACVIALTGAPGAYNIASGHSFSVNEIADYVADAFGVPGYPWQHKGKKDPRGSVRMSVAQAAKTLYWKPHTNIREGISKTVKWWSND